MAVKPFMCMCKGGRVFVVGGFDLLAEPLSKNYMMKNNATLT